MDIKVSNLGKRYDFQFVVRNLNLNIQSGAAVGIAGRNGSGKSTTMQMLAGYLTPSEGNIEYRIADRKTDRMDLYKHLAYAAPYIDLPQKVTVPELFTHYTKFKKVNLGSYKEFIHFCEMDKTEEKYLTHFSSGMKQKIALALAMITECELLLLDEPTSYLDSHAKAWFLNGLKTFKGGKTTIIASNDVSDFEFCNHVYEIK